MTTDCGARLLGVCAALVAAGCAASGPSGHDVVQPAVGPLAAPTTLAPAALAPVAAPAPLSCSIGRAAPQVVAVAIGRPVRFENRDTICHRPFSSSGPNAFELPLLQPGAAAELRFEHRGAVRVYCALHEAEQFTIEVDSNGGAR